MKELVLKNGQREIVFEEFNNLIGIKKKEEGYYIYDLEQTFGPFLNVYFNFLGRGATLCGFNDEKSIAVVAGHFGCTEIKESDYPIEFKRLIKKKRIEKVSQQFPTCKFLSEVLVYKLIKEENPLFEKKDGYSRQLTPAKRYLYETEDGKIFSANPKSIKPVDQYRKFDTFEEMQLVLLANKKEYSDIEPSPNGQLAYLFRNLYYGRALPCDLIQRIFNKIKSKVGVEEFRHLEKPVEICVKKHKRIDVDLLIQTLKNERCSNLFKFITNLKPCKVNEEIIPAAVEREIEACVRSLPSFNFDELIIKYKDVKIVEIIDCNEEVEKNIKRKDLYEWSGFRKLQFDKPKSYQELVNVEMKKYKECIKIMLEEKPAVQKHADHVCYTNFPSIYEIETKENEAACAEIE